MNSINSDAPVTTLVTGHNMTIGLRKTFIIAGALYLLTFVSIPTLSLYNLIRKPDYLGSSASDIPVISGGILEIIVALAGIGTAVVLYPVLKKQNVILALGLVCSRVLEASTIFTGVSFVLSLVTLHQDQMPANAFMVSHTLVALYDRIFLLGQSFIPAIDDVLLGVLLYKSRLIPRSLSLIGIFGAIPLLAAYFGVLFGVLQMRSVFTGLAAVPVAVFELSVGVCLLLRGLRSSSDKSHTGE